MASRQKVSSAGVASLDRCYHGLPRKLPAGGSSLDTRAGTWHRVSREYVLGSAHNSRRLAPAGPLPRHAGRTRPFV